MPTAVPAGGDGAHLTPLSCLGRRFMNTGFMSGLRAVGTTAALVGVDGAPAFETAVRGDGAAVTGRRPPTGPCPRPRCRGRQRTLLTALSGLVAQALERARLYDAEHSRAKSLQRGLLPRSLPRLPAVTAAASYLPASEGAAVGGDWYDLIPLSADRVAMVVGDVMGHGIAEAATMGRLRTAVHTLADLEMPPDEMFGHLNDLVKELGDDSHVTCLYAVYDPVSRICTFCLAGHPPPVVVHPDGTLHRPVLVANPPLGAAEPPFDTQELRLPEQCVLVFYTDGLLRSVDRDADEGVALLVSAVADALEETSYFSRACDGDGGACLGRLCDIITTQLTQDRPRAVDDAALFLTHTRVTAPDDVRRGR